MTLDILSIVQEKYSEKYKKIMDENYRKSYKLTRETDAKIECLKIRYLIENPGKLKETKVEVSIRTINMFGFRFNFKLYDVIPYNIFDIHIKKCGYCIASELIVKSNIDSDDYNNLCEHAVLNDMSSIKYIKNPPEKVLKIVAYYSPENLPNVQVSIPQEVQDFILDTNPESIRYVSNPTESTALRLIKMSPCMITYLPAAVKNYPSVVGHFVAHHFTIFRNVKSLRAFKTVENLEIPEKVFKTLKKISKETGNSVLSY